jgi:SAM-dependent methyltransferase
MPVAEDLWGYGKRFRFVDDCLVRRFGANRQDVRILDVGCGTGKALAIPLAQIGYQVTGVDPHAESIRFAAASAPLGADFRCGVLSDLAPQRFHAVIISEVLEHLEDPESLLRAALDYLADNGLMIITVPNGYGEFEIDSRLFHRLRLYVVRDAVHSVLRKLGRRKTPQIPGSYDTKGHIQRFTLSRLRRIFAGHDLRIIQSRASVFVAGPLIGHTLGHFGSFIRFNARLADWLPPWACSGWFFALERTGSANGLKPQAPRSMDAIRER